jgi:hypothetical protein
MTVGVTKALSSLSSREREREEEKNVPLVLFSRQSVLLMTIPPCRIKALYLQGF